MKVGSLCTGYGGLDMAAQSVFGGDLAWVSDVEPGPISLLDHHHPDVPNLGDLKVIDWAAVEPVDLLTAGYPCQPFSNAGKRKGTDDPRHLWPWIAYAIARLRPRVVVLENVGAHLRRGFPVVAADLAALGYRVAWTLLRASDVDAAHCRERLFILAVDAHSDGRERLGGQQDPLGDQVERAAAAAGDRGEAAAHSDCTPRDGWSGYAVPGTGPAQAGERSSEPGRLVGLASDPEGLGRREGGAEPAGVERRPDAAYRREPLDWQEFEPAIRRWERSLGRPAPAPSVLGPRGGVKVAPAFGEWLMGLPEGHITDVPGLSINEQLKLVGNGVVPQQAEAAIRHLADVLGLWGSPEQAAA